MDPVSFCNDCFRKQKVNNDLDCYFYEQLPREIQCYIITFLDWPSCVGFAQTNKLNHLDTLRYGCFTNPRGYKSYDPPQLFPPGSNYIFLKYISTNSENVYILALILANPNFDPSANNNAAIIKASRKGHDKVVELLLHDERVDPSDIHNSALKEASKNGHDKVVVLLLHDKRIDPSAYNNIALREASRNGHNKVVLLLLKDQRVAKKLYSRASPLENYLKN